MDRQWLGRGCLAVSALAYGFAPTLNLISFQNGFNVTSLLVLRFALAALLFAPLVRLGGYSLRLPRRDLARLFLLGAVLYLAIAWLYTAAQQYISVALAVLLMYTYPLMVVLQARVFQGRRLGGAAWACLLLALTGLVEIVGVSFARINWLGAALALGSAAAYTFYVVHCARAIRTQPAPVASFYIFLFAFLGAGALGLESGTLHFPAFGTAYLPILALSAGATLLPILAFLKGLEYIDESQASVLAMLEPLFATIFAGLILGQELTAAQALGGAVLVAGICGVLYFKNRSALLSPALSDPGP